MRRPTARLVSLPWLCPRSATWRSGESRQHVDLSLDLLSIQDMDTGQYQAMVIQDPDNRRRISRYVHLAQAFGRNREIKNAGTEITNYQNLDFLLKLSTNTPTNSVRFHLTIHSSYSCPGRCCPVVRHAWPVPGRGWIRRDHIGAKREDEGRHIRSSPTIPGVPRPQ